MVLVVLKQSGGTWKDIATSSLSIPQLEDETRPREDESDSIGNYDGQ
jgi:hypothetical protein